MNQGLKYSKVALWVAVILFFGLALTGWATRQQIMQNNTAANRAVVVAANRVAREVQNTMRLYQYGLRGARGAVLTAGDNLNRELFLQYSKSRDLAVEFPGARGFGVIRRIRPEDEAAFTQEARKDGWPDFTVHQFAPHGGERYVIQYFEPVEGSENAIGLDIASEDNRRITAETAARTGQADLSAPLVLVVDEGTERRSFLLLLPIYRNGIMPDTDAEREAKVMGWTYVPLSITDVLTRINNFDAEVFHVRLRDITEPGKEAVFFETKETAANTAELYTQRLERDVYGRKWQIEVGAHPAFVEGLNQVRGRSVFMGGMLATLLLSTLGGALNVSRQRKELIVAEQARLATIVGNSSDAIVGESLDGTIMSWNRAAERLFGYGEAEMLGKPLAERLVPADRHSEDQEILERIGRNEGVTPFDTVRLHRDGTPIDVAITVGAIQDTNDRTVGAAKLMRDIRDRKAEERRLAGFNAMLEQQVAERTAALQEAKASAEAANTAKGQFLAMMSHELRTPMTGVLGMADLLLTTDLQNEQRILLQTLTRSAKTLLELLNDILDFAKIEAGRTELESIDFSIGQIAEDVGEVIQPLASEKANAVAVNIAPSIRSAYLGDAKHYRQVLMNLVGNANKFTTEGQITISVKELSSDDGRCMVETLVTDTGIGIAEGNREQLFQPFIQEDISTSRKFGGTGLGLAISKNLVELMGGRIWLDSTLGQGSAFGFTVALKPGNAEKLEVVNGPRVRTPRAVDKLPTPNRQLQVLVAEDNQTNRMLVTALLTRMGHMVSSVENGAEAVARITRTHFDIVLMDMQMPVMDGPTAMRKIRGLSTSAASVPMIALTADAMREHHGNYLAAGANSVITKPVDWYQLTTEMERLTTGRSGNQTPAPEDATVQPATEPAPLPVLDTLYLESVTGSIDAKIVATLLDSLVENIVSYSSAITAASTNDDLAGAKRTGHALKGLAAQFGAPRLSDLARTLEVTATEHDHLVALAPRIAATAAETLSAIRAWRGRPQKSA